MLKRVVFMHEHTRKIVRIGETSYGVILPISWLRYNQMDERSKVKVISNDEIIIRKCKDAPDTGTLKRAKRTNSTTERGGVEDEQPELRN